MPDLAALLDRLEELLGHLQGMDEDVRAPVFELLDGIDAVHRLALDRLAAALGPDELERLRVADPAIAWLLDAYSAGVDERQAADRALDAVRPYVEGHGGTVELMDVSGGVVRLRLAGACAGCTASAQTLQRGVHEALQDGFPGFLRMEVEEDVTAPAHPPPGAVLLPIVPRGG
ncbi:NifU family protein [Pseudonocardia nigra]|uniref:NifU family protein n=1 Tax=Pseudonocardia nigra TaxID=1921578 RepID=UPI001C5E456E|nr:NifU family protein [Pseudonocardia nigra]